jgi:uncharacterized protein
VRILLDTNVLIASLISQGLCHELIAHCFLNHQLVTSDFILTELSDKLVEKFRYSTASVDEAVELFNQSMEVVVPIALSEAVSRDSDDDMILATAKSGSCEIIITGDKDLLVLENFEGIRIVTPKEFVEQEQI